MKKEIDAIRAKDIAQGGLTQGQQTQIARNEQRMSQVYDIWFVWYKCQSLLLLFDMPYYQFLSLYSDEKFCFITSS